MNPLPSLAPLQLIGPDVRSFLQGQVSNDLNALTTENSLLACCNSAQGRVQAIMHLIERREGAASSPKGEGASSSPTGEGAASRVALLSPKDGIIALVPSVMLDTTLARLRKYVLRAKLTLHDARNALHCHWAEESELAVQAWPVPQRPGEHRQQGDISVLRWPDPNQARFLVLRPASAAISDNAVGESRQRDWQLADIRAGLPQVLPETHESFVAQMLNLDVLGGISFDKGCYTGQEIIARAHFRGAVKRRMFRLQAACSAPPPGTRILSNGESAGEVVVAANTEHGCELLAVLSLAQHAAPLMLGGETPLQLLSLPYEVPTSV